jgi:hypothetical protein
LQKRGGRGGLVGFHSQLGRDFIDGSRHYETTSSWVSAAPLPLSPISEIWRSVHSIQGTGSMGERRFAIALALFELASWIMTFHVPARIGVWLAAGTKTKTRICASWAVRTTSGRPKRWVWVDATRLADREYKHGPTTRSPILRKLWASKPRQVYCDAIVINWGVIYRLEVKIIKREFRHQPGQ